MNIREKSYKSNRLKGLSQEKAAIEAGYSPATAHNAYKIENRVKDGIQDALEKAGLTDSFISNKIFEKVSSDNEGIQIRALELVAKLRKYLSDVTVDQSKHYTKVTYTFKDEKLADRGLLAEELSS